jgi:ADP-ribosylglycohydrolase
MLGAIAGDMIGSPYEYEAFKGIDFPLFSDRSRFTDDTVLTVATGFALMTDREYGEAYRIFGRLYPLAGYGETFLDWLHTDEPRPYGSWGNGAAMRVSPVGWACESVEEVLAEAARSAACTHDHPEGIKGAQATALGVFLARRGRPRALIMTEIEERFGYDLGRTPDEIRPGYEYDISCQGTVPPALSCFLHGKDFEETVRLAVSLGGDADTLAAIAGSFAHAAEGKLPPAIRREIRRRLELAPDLLQIVDDFCERYGVA